jgi:serine/threonine-protein kinase
VKDNGDIIQFLKQRDYIMMNNSLGRGSFGKTVLLRDPFIDELFVVKKYEPAFDDPLKKKRFFRSFLDEIKILYKLNHRNVIRIFNYYAYENVSTGYILMEYIDGVNIGKFFSDYSNSFSYLAITLDDIFSQLIDGFQYIEEHRIIHRDIRESNILIDETGTVKIIDFGIGKIIENCDTDTDSLVSDINRVNPDTLPLEYFEGIYTSKTDMFYLGELLNRLLNIPNLVGAKAFSHHDILEKMMKKMPTDRYSSFAEIRDAINKRNFSIINISQQDKNIYQKFADSLYNALYYFYHERTFISEISLFVAKLDKILQDNCFEDIIQSNAELIGCIVIGEYEYDDNASILYDVVLSFRNWFKSSTTQYQQLILNNIIAKLSTVRAEEPLPF